MKDRLCERSAKRFERVAAAALPSAVAFGRAAGLPERVVRRLSAEMAAEVSMHEKEAIELPPRPQDVPFPDGVDPWWRQAVRQLVGIAFNAGQYYLLQYLPATKADLKREREQPRGPLF